MPQSKPDPFDDLESLKLSQDFVANAGVKRILQTVPVRKPNPQEFVRVHPDRLASAPPPLIELQEDREIYRRDARHRRSLPGEFSGSSTSRSAGRACSPVAGAPARAGRQAQRLAPFRRKRPRWRSAGCGSSANMASAPTRYSRRQARHPGTELAGGAVGGDPQDRLPRQSHRPLTTRCCSGCAASLDAATVPRRSGCVDFEFAAHRASGRTRCALVARELRSGRKVRLWRDEFGAAAALRDRPDSAVRRLLRLRRTGLPSGARLADAGAILDLFAEFRFAPTADRPPAIRCSGPRPFGLDPMGAVEKEAMRDLILRGGLVERRARKNPRLLRRGRDALARLLPAMLPRIDLPRALLAGPLHGGRGRHGARRASRSISRCWRCCGSTGPASRTADRRDRYRLRRLRGPHVQDRPVRRNGSPGIPWPRLESGNLDLSDDTFRANGQGLSRSAPLRELRSALADCGSTPGGWPATAATVPSCRPSAPAPDETSRATSVHFGPSVWLRGLIKPPPGQAVAYIDWAQQEFGIAAALSGDAAWAAYCRATPISPSPSRRARAARRHEGNARPDPRAVQAVRAGDPVRHGSARAWPCASASRRSSRASCCGRTARPIARSGAGPMPRSITPCCTAAHTVFGWPIHVGAASQPAVAAEISRCRPTAPRCCGWPAAWRPSAASRSPRRCTTPY